MPPSFHANLFALVPARGLPFYCGGAMVQGDRWAGRCSVRTAPGTAALGPPSAPARARGSPAGGRVRGRGHRAQIPAPRRGRSGRSRVPPPQGPCEGREAMETVIACAVTAVLSSTVTLVAYACCVAAGNEDRIDGEGE